MLDTLGRVISRHPWVVIGVWICGVIVALAAAFGGVFGQPLFERLGTGEVTTPGETADGTALLAQLPTDSGPAVILLLDRIDLKSQQLRSALTNARKDITARPDVKSEKDPFSESNKVFSSEALPTSTKAQKALIQSFPLVSDDQRALIMVVTLRDDLSTDASAQSSDEIRDRLEEVAPQVPGAKGYVGGVNLIVSEVTEQVERDLRTGEGTALPISFAIMIIVFGGFLAAMLPIAGALAAIAGAMATLLGFSYLLTLDASTVNVVTVLGLGLCIDYGLLLVSRYREEMVALPGDRHLPPTRRQRELALARTMSTAGRTVLFSGVTVAVSLCGLLVFRATFLRAIGAAGVSVVAVAVLVALTLIPALLAVVRVRMIRPGLVHRLPGIGRLVRRLGDVSPEEGAFSRLARVVQRFPVIVLMIVLSALFVMSLPVLKMELVANGVALLPKENEQRQLFDNLAERFPLTANPTITIVADATEKEAVPLVNTVKSLPGVTSVDPAKYRGVIGDGTKITTINVRVAGVANNPTAQKVVRDIRTIEPGYRTWTTGDTSALVDYLDDLKARAPLALLVVVLATFVLLFLMTGSVLVPIKALIMNVVSLGASLGVLVLIFQDGYLEGLLHFSAAGGIETFIPPMTLAFGFGLAMDYEVFLLSRIAEYRRRGYNNDEAVVSGLQASGRIITSAALIIVVVFAGFVSGQLLIIKETGTALAVAVAIDATLVRMLLVPATMTLLGEWNWWAPPFLRRLHDRYGLREEH